jgi:hypothetical protein
MHCSVTPLRAQQSMYCMQCRTVRRSGAMTRHAQRHKQQCYSTPAAWCRRTPVELRHGAPAWYGVLWCALPAGAAKQTMAWHVRASPQPMQPPYLHIRGGHMAGVQGPPVAAGSRGLHHHPGVQLPCGATRGTHGPHSHPQQRHGGLALRAQRASSLLMHTKCMGGVGLRSDLRPATHTASPPTPTIHSCTASTAECFN